MLEIGTGSGYLTACLARLAREVVSLERHADLADAARARLAAQGIGNADVETVPMRSRGTTERTFDAICVTGAVDSHARALHRVAEAGRPPVRGARPFAGDGSGAGPSRRQRTAHRIVV